MTQLVIGIIAAVIFVYIFNIRLNIRPAGFFVKIVSFAHRTNSIGVIEIEATLSDGRVLRSARGVLWAFFPSGVEASPFICVWLSDAYARAERVRKWEKEK